MLYDPKWEKEPWQPSPWQPWLSRGRLIRLIDKVLRFAFLRGAIGPARIIIFFALFVWPPLRPSFQETIPYSRASSPAATSPNLSQRRSIFPSASLGFT